MHDDISGLGNDLKNADEDTVREIVREAEKFLDSQLSAGIAADQRAVTFASVLTAAVAVLIGGLVVAATSERVIDGFGWFAVPVSASLLVAIAFAVAACRPTDWCYAGNNPRLWRTEVLERVALKDALADQAEQYAKGIVDNRNVLDANARLMAWAFRWAGIALVLGVITIIYITAS